MRRFSLVQYQAPRRPAQRVPGGQMRIMREMGFVGRTGEASGMKLEAPLFFDAADAQRALVRALTGLKSRNPVRQNSEAAT